MAVLGDGRCRFWPQPTLTRSKSRSAAVSYQRCLCDNRSVNTPGSQEPTSVRTIQVSPKPGLVIGWASISPANSVGVLGPIGSRQEEPLNIRKPWRLRTFTPLSFGLGTSVLGP